MPTAARFPLTWDLDSLFPHPTTPEFRTVLDRFRDRLIALADRSDRLPAVSGDRTAVSEWAAVLREYEAICRLREDLSSFVGCHAAADAANKRFQQLEAELSTLEPPRQRIATNLEFALKSAGEADLKALLAGDEWLREIEFFLHESRRNAAFRLPKPQELLAADLGVDGVHAWGRLYDRLSGAVRVRVLERGEIVEKSVGQVQFTSPERSVRQNNFYAADKAWNAIADTCADAVNHIAGARLTLYRHLGLRDHLDRPLRHNRLRRETLDAMWSAVSRRKPVLLKYMNRKARLLGLDKLAWYDTQAPLPSTLNSQPSTLAWDDACRMVIDTAGRFSPEFGEFCRTALEGGWIEAENRSGKRQGGFCTGFPTAKQSRIFMTFTDSADSMSTLAHELGHAYHAHVLRDRPVFLQEYPMNLAETASTFAEAVLGEERLRVAASTGERLEILDHMLADAVSFLMNIHARFVFEDRFHRERAAGEVPAERLSELMLQAQRETYCEGLADDGWNPRFWVSKLHFYISSLPFYNFPYTFGYLLSLGLYAASGEFGREFPDRYRSLLLATGDRETEDAVRSTLGYDLTREDFWNRSLDVVDRRVEQFLELSDGGDR
ncbi:MAG TPA: M3 family oligoendopeptidase [Planctomycetaceae bacterium]|nr:M3 family oligoendopeptidase [Planctomycetaceae bacterium]